MIWCCLWYSRNTKNFQKYIFYLWYILNLIWCEYFYNSTMTQACGRCCEPCKVVQVRALQVQMSTQGGIYTKYNLQEQSKPDLRMERPDQQTSKPSSLILRFLHQNIHAATIFPLKSSWMSFWSNLIYVLFPIFATNPFLKMTTISPGWDGGGGVSWSSLSRLRGRDPVSSGFPSPPFINHFVSLKFFSPVIWLYCCSGSLRNALLLDITKSWIWYRCDHHNPPIILIIISVFSSNITNIYVGDDYMIYVSSFPISPTNGSPGPVRCLIREILVGSLIKPGLGTFTLDLSGHKSWDRGKYEFTNLHIWSILKTHWNVVWFLFKGNLADPDFVNQTLVWLYSDYQIKTEVRRCTNLLTTMLHLIDVSGICISAETHWEHGRAGS